MFIDHIGLYVMNNIQELRLLGRASFPIFAIIYGYHFNNRLNMKLLIYGLPIFILNYCVYKVIFFNILYCFFFGGFLLNIYNTKIKTNFTKTIFFITLFLLNPSISIYFDYGICIFFFMLAANQKDKRLKTIWFTVVFFVYYVAQCLHFSFNYVNSIILAIILGVEGTLLFFYENRTISNRDRALEICIKILARYSLEIFVVQAILFITYDYLNN